MLAAARSPKSTRTTTNSQTSQTRKNTVKTSIASIALAATGLLLMSGCSSSAIAKDGHYDDASDLLAAFTEAGGQCASTADDQEASDSGSKIDCGADLVLEVHEGSLGPDISEWAANISGSHILKGENWSITSPFLSHLENVAEELDGDLVVSPSSTTTGSMSGRS